MYKIAILGCENSHADTFITFIKESYPDIEVVGVYSDEEDANERIRNNFGIYTASSYDEFVGKIDGLIVTARHGANHLKYAAPYITSGIPMFIDKPITCDENDALTLARECKKSGVRLTGGSCLQYSAELAELKAHLAEGEEGKLYGGFVRAPLDKNDKYGGFWFYSQHLVQIMQELFGYYPVSVQAHIADPAYNFTVSYEGFDVFASFVVNDYNYYAHVSDNRGVKGGAIQLPISIFEEEFRQFYLLLQGKEQKQSYRDFISTVYIISAMTRSLESGKCEAVNAPPAEENI